VLKSLAQSDWDLQAPLANVAWRLNPFQYAEAGERVERSAMRVVDVVNFMIAVEFKKHFKLN
jgi:hypothetical protein